jgi:hypothetical protein
MADSSGGGRNRPKPHIYVPMPEAPGVYPREQGTSKRDLLIRRYGEVSVMHAEVAVCVNIMVQLGIIKTSEFVQLVEQGLATADIRRQRHAESGGREA